jgi:uncharacterized protein DUF5753/helix-turn-helix protein
MREEAGLTLDDVVGPLYWSRSKVSRIEKGQQSVDIHGVRSMLDLYDVGGGRSREVIELTLQTREKGWWRTYGLDDFGYVPLEAEATSVREYALGYVPGLLQTEDYARAMFEASPTRRTRDEVASQLRIRAIRQQRLTCDDDPVELVAIVDESVLHRPIGGPGVLRAQLARLVEAAGPGRATLQVLPTATGAHPALQAGFIVLGFERLGLPDMAYVEHPMGSIQLEREDDVAAATMVFDRLRSLALSPADSVALVREVAAHT